jgi:hypothetical protein
LNTSTWAFGDPPFVLSCLSLQSLPCAHSLLPRCSETSIAQEAPRCPTVPSDPGRRSPRHARLPIMLPGKCQISPGARKGGPRCAALYTPPSPEGERGPASPRKSTRERNGPVRNLSGQSKQNREAEAAASPPRSEIASPGLEAWLLTQAHCSLENKEKNKRTTPAQWARGPGRGRGSGGLAWGC